MAKKRATQQETQTNPICEYVRKAENDYISGTTKIGKHVEFSQYETIERIMAYLNSKHISGELDALGREKPFFNISVAVRNIWYRATDIDRKQIKIKPTRLDHRVMAYGANLHLQEWMRKAAFGTFLNEWGRELAGFGSIPIKFVEKGADLFASVIPWNRMISDTVNFEKNPKIEVLWLTPAELQENEAYDQDMVSKLIDSQTSRQITDGERQDNRLGYIKVYEVHGKFPLEEITGQKRDRKKYRQQMHVLSFVAKDDDEYEDFSLYKGREAKDPYMLTHLIKEDGRALSIGSVEYLFDSQWMLNHSVKLMKDQLDLASKIIMQTSDGNFAGRNVLTSLEVGDVLVHKINEGLTQVNNKADISVLQNFGAQWVNNAKELTSTPDALRGLTQPSGTAWHQVEAIQQEGHSLFDLMRQNKANDIEKMMREFVIPYLKKQMDTVEELAVTLDQQGITEFDSMWVPNQVILNNNDQFKKTVLSGQIGANADPAVLEQSIRQGASQLGNKRYLKAGDIDGKKWKAAFKNLEWEVEVDPVNEAEDLDAVLTTLNTTFGNIVRNPAILQDPTARMLFNKILEKTDAVSPLEITTSPAPVSQPAPVGGPTVTPQSPLNTGGQNGQ